MNSAPAESRTSRIGTTWPVGAPRLLGSVEKEYCVLAMQTGQMAVACGLQLLELRRVDRCVGDDVGGAVDLGGDGLDLVPQRHVVRDRAA